MFAPLVLLTLAADPSLADVIRDDRTYWYDRETLPGCYVEVGSLLPLGYNTATFPGQEDATGSANNEHPWLHTGGLDDCGPEVTVKRLLWLPPRQKIRLRMEWREVRRGHDRGPRYLRIQGDFPVGTVSAELLYDADRLFEVRERRKHNDGWFSGILDFGHKPQGYSTVDNCVDCHADIGKHSTLIDYDRDWYGVIRGLEKDGPIHFHPFDVSGFKRGDVRLPVRIRSEVRHFVVWEDGS